MADRRRVSVHLELETARYVGPAGEVAAVTRRVRSEVDELGDQADNASRDLDLLAANSNLAKHQVDDLGDKALKTAAELSLLERQIHSVSRAAGGMDMTPSSGGAGGRIVRRGVGSGLDLGGEGIRLRSGLITMLVSAVVAASPIIGAMVAGAVTGAAGLGGIAGGIASAARDPRVKAAASGFSKAIGDEFFGHGGAFVQPTIDSLRILEKAFRDMDLGGAFGKLAPFVTEVAEGLAAMMRNIMPGLNKAFDRMGPFLAVMSEGFGDLGTQIGDFFNRLSRSQGAVMGLESLFHFLNGALIIVGATIEWLSNRYKDLIHLLAFSTGILEDLPLPHKEEMRQVNDAFERMIDNADRTGPAGHHAADGLTDFQISAKLTADALRSVNEEMDKLANKTLALDEANLAYRQDLLTLTESVKEHGTSLNLNTQAGIDNQQMIDGLIGDLMRTRDAAIDAAEGNEEAERRARAAYRKQLAELEALLIKLGFAPAAIQAIIDKYEQLAREPDITKTIRIREVRSGELFPKGSVPPGRASGGPGQAGTLYQIHEEGLPEFYRPSSSGQFIPLSQMPAAMSTAGGARPLTANFMGNRAFQVLFDEIVREVGNRGGTLAVLGIRG